MSFTSTTAPNKPFASREELAQHYKSDWHRYNLKRKEAGLAPVNEDDFNARLEAALAMRREKEGREKRDGKDHLKSKKNRKAQEQTAAKKSTETTTPQGTQEDTEMKHEEEEEEEEPPEIDPRQCLFSNQKFESIASNVEHMKSTYDFYVPDVEYLDDMEGFVGYCSEKVKLGNLCLYCHKGFASYSATQKHMIAKRHCKVKYEAGVDLEEFEVFYDFTEANDEYFGNERTKNTANDDDVVMEEGDDEDGEWEDIPDDDESPGRPGKKNNYDGYADIIKTHGFGVTELGELILPNGKVIGHRGLNVYYNQRFAPDGSNNEAIVAVRQANHERFWGYGSQRPLNEVRRDDIAAKITGRKKNGILVPTQGGFTALSLYRYRAIVRKSRRDEAKGKRLHERTGCNMNKMDKKGNRMITNVSVAHALR